MSETTVLIVPGLREHVPDHWQTRLAEALPRSRTVAPLEVDKLDCAARVAAIESALAGIAGSVILVAHSAGVIMVAHWARSSRHTGRIRGALLAAPADLESPMPAGYPTVQTLDEHGWLPVPRVALPFTSIVAAGSNDPLARLDRSRALARDWGSRFVELGAVGHLNPASGHGEWPRAMEFVRELA